MPRARLTSSAAGTAVTAARRPSSASASRTPARMKRAGNLSRLFAPIARSRRDSWPSASGFDGVHERAVAGWPPQVGRRDVDDGDEPAECGWWAR